MGVDLFMLWLMKAMKLGRNGGLDRLNLVDLPDPAAPAAGEIQVRVHGSSLNFHDYAVVRFDAPHTVRASASRARQPGSRTRPAAGRRRRVRP